MSKVADILPLMVKDLPGYDPVITLKELQKTAQEFCRLTESWRETLPAIDLTADDSTYTLNSRRNGIILRITSLKIDDIEQNSTYYTFTEGRTLTLGDEITPSSNDSGGLVVVVAIMPRLDAKYIEPDSFVERWRTALIAGALANLQDMKRQRWYDPFQAKLNRLTFEREKAMARREAEAGSRAVVMRVRPRPWR